MSSQRVEELMVRDVSVIRSDADVHEHANEHCDGHVNCDLNGNGD